MRFLIAVSLLFLCGCGSRVDDLRKQYALEKDKLADQERALLEFERFQVDLAGQERVEDNAVDRVKKSMSEPGAPKEGQKFEDDRKYVETEKERRQSSDRLESSAHAKLVEEVKQQKQRVAELEARLRQAEK